MTQFFKPIGSLCNPAKVYIAISVVSILASLMSDSISGVVFHGFMAVLWAFFLGWLCDKGHTTTSWLLVLWLPAMMLLLVVFGTLFLLTRSKQQRADLIDKMKKYENHKKNGGSFSEPSPHSQPSSHSQPSPATH
jgi:ABC-type nickel/cobalt efflux system permease component RcnA